MRQMQIAAPGGLDNLVMVDAPETPPPGPGEIRVRIRASSLNFHDLIVASRPDWVADGRIPLADGAGVVDSVGAGVEGFAPGDHVVSGFFPQWLEGPDMPGDFSGTPGDGIDGFAREWVTLPATAFTLSPKGWSHAEAATITTAGLTAWRALVVNGGLKAGETVLVLGTGGVSIYALQIAKAMGARVIATSSSDAKLERVRALGAEAVINYRTTPDWGAEVRALTGGRGVDHVIEVGGPATLEQSIAAARIGGHISLIGVLTGRSGEVPTSALMARQQRLQGLIVGSRRHQTEFVAALDATGLRPVIDREFPLDELREAFEWQAAGSHFGKIVVSV
ncbi:NAD(P)-dependent alcohol dehydrogenase [Paroceanicella profunda]|uniref:NAD(P)-dependent alcohol dehydrogenase n=2 Tax=Paroceanicella profunda TaxID=2579971 RepID=A0A5B8FYN0_9RHOB|nr:NAD(P)-dependent alcohol dehydrogenase [Paroceanicella profunda]